MVGFMKSALNLFGIKKEGGNAEGAKGLEEFLGALPEQLGYDVSFRKSEATEGGLRFEIEGSEVDSFVGNSSEILDALSHLAMRVSRKHEGLSNEPVGEESRESFRIVFDANGFRDRKADELRTMAGEKRQKVVDAGGKPSYIPALCPSDRKIIHTHLATFGDVVSESIGKGNFKRIRIRLKGDERPMAEGGNSDQQPRHANGNGNGHGRNGQGGGGRNGGRGGRGRRGGQGQGRGNFQQRPRNNGGEVDGNRIDMNPNRMEHAIDDNIGNRLPPGEVSPFASNYGSNDYGSDTEN